jgi:hypothetical protein
MSLIGWWVGSEPEYIQIGRRMSINHSVQAEDEEVIAEHPMSSLAANHPLPHINDGAIYGRIFLHRSLGRAQVQTLSGPEDDDNERWRLSLSLIPVY